MGKLLDGFIAQYENEDAVLSLKDLMSDEEIGEWELLVKVFTDLEITEIGPSLAKINKYYRLNRNQEMAARDKVMLGQDPNGESLHPDNVTRVTNFDNGGGMFG